MTQEHRFNDIESLANEPKFREEVLLSLQKLLKKPDVDIMGENRKWILRILSLTGQAMNAHGRFSVRYTTVEPIDIAYALERISHETDIIDELNVSTLLGLNSLDLTAMFNMTSKLLDYFNGEDLVPTILVRNPVEPYTTARFEPPFGMNAVAETYGRLLDHNQFDFSAFLYGLYMHAGVIDKWDERRNAVDFFKSYFGFDITFVPHQGEVMPIHRRNLAELLGMENRVDYLQLSGKPMDTETLTILKEQNAIFDNSPYSSFSFDPYRDQDHTSAYILFEKGHGCSDIMTLLYIGFTYGLSAMLGAVVGDASDTFGKLYLGLTEFDEKLGQYIYSHPGFRKAVPAFLRSENIENLHKSVAIVFGTTYRPEDYDLHYIPSGSVRYQNAIYRGLANGYINRYGDSLDTVLRTLIHVVEKAESYLEMGNFEDIPPFKLNGFRKSPKLPEIIEEFIERYKFFLARNIIPITRYTEVYYNTIGTPGNSFEDMVLSERGPIFVDYGYPGFN